MTSTEVATNIGIGKFIHTLRVHFSVYITEPDKERKEADWFNGIANAVQYFSDEVLEEATHRILTTRTNKHFPLPSELVKVCGQIKSEREPPRLLNHEVKAKGHAFTYSRDRIRFTVEALRTPDGKRAIREGWIGVLFDETRRRNEVPPASEFGDLRKKAQEFHELHVKCHRGEAGWKSKDLAQVGDSMEKRYRLVAAVIQGLEPIEKLHMHLSKFEEGEAKA